MVFVHLRSLGNSQSFVHNWRPNRTRERERIVMTGPGLSWSGLMGKSPPRIKRNGKRQLGALRRRYSANSLKGCAHSDGLSQSLKAIAYQGLRRG